MSVSQQSVEKDNSTNAFVTSLATNAALLVIQVGAFSYLKGRLTRVYEPRTFLPPPDKRAIALPSGPWKWVAALITSDSKEIIRKNGLDAYLFIRFLKLLVGIFTVFVLVSWPVLLAVDTAGIPTDQGRDNLSRLSWGNIPTNMQTRYAAHVVVVYILTFFVIWLIRRELGIFVTLRHQFLVSHSHSKLAQAKTVLITNLPDTVQTESDLQKLLTFVPGGIRKIWIYRKSGNLPDLFEDRLKACTKLEKAECKLLRSALKAKRTETKAQATSEKVKRKEVKKAVKKGEDGSDAAERIERDVEKNERQNIESAYGKVVRPAHHTGKIPFTGPKVDTINWCKDEIVRLTTLINDGRKNLGRDPSHGAAFVQCNLQLGANLLAQVVVSDEPLRMYDKWTDVAPDDIVWRNIDDSGYEVRARYVTSWLAMIALIVLWTFPVAFTGLLSNIDALCVRVSWLAWVCRLPKVARGIISGLLPPVFLAILLMVLPFLLRGLAWYENIPRYSLISLSVYKRYFIFLIIHGFLVVTLSSGLTAAIPQIVQAPGTLVESLATRLPDASIFFLTYTVTTGLTGAASALLQVASLFLYFIHRWLFGDTPRQAYKKTYVMPKADFGVVLPRISLVAAIALAYSIIAPIINGLALLSFALLWVAWKFLFTWVFDQPEYLETGGLYFPLALSNLFVGLYIEQICLAGLFFLATDTQGRRSCIPQGVLMVALLAITCTAQIFLVKTYGPITKSLPTACSTKKIQDRWERKQKGEHELLPDLFSRDRVSKLVRRKLKLDVKPVDTHAIIAQEKKEEAAAIEEKERKAKENAHDLEMLAAIVNSSFVNGGSAAHTPAAEEPDERTATRQSSRSSKKGKGKAMAEAEAVPEIRAGLPKDAPDDWDSSDDDNEDNAFNHPSTYKDTPVIWIPKDDLGLSTFLVDELVKAGVYASDDGAYMDEKGNVEVKRSPPDEEWGFGHDL